MRIKPIIVLLLLAIISIPQPLRLHIRANSDDPADQSVKLAVRDAVIKAMEEPMKKAHTRTQAREILMENGDKILDAAQETLNDAGMDYGVRLGLGWTEFPDRDYGGKVYPAGEYEALLVLLGEGEGKNWWCVMYPPLCLGEIQQSDQPIQMRSAIADAFEGGIKGFFKTKQ